MCGPWDMCLAHATCPMCVSHSDSKCASVTQGWKGHVLFLSLPFSDVAVCFIVKQEVLLRLHPPFLAYLACSAFPFHWFLQVSCITFYLCEIVLDWASICFSLHGMFIFRYSCTLITLFRVKFSM